MFAEIGDGSKHKAAEAALLLELSMLISKHFDHYF